jgi:hypothetical protein
MRAKLFRPAVIVPVAVVAAVALGVGLYLFQPWRLFVDTTVNEASPLAAVSAPASPDAVADPSEASEPADAPAESATPAEPVEEAMPRVVARGSLISHEHATTGEVLLIERPDGSRVLRIEGLDTSNGPDLKVWLTDAPVIEGTDGWYVFDDGRYVDLGALKGNVGNQNYPIPDGVSIDDLSSVSIWCARFAVSFGAAELAAA